MTEAAPSPPSVRPGKAKLPSLDLGRFVAAFFVLLFHYGYLIQHFTGALPLGMIFRAGHAGVEYFFVLSGFIIAYAHRQDIGRPDRTGSFFAKRAIRILPMLWLTLLLWGGLRMILSSETTHGETGIGTILLDMLLLPHGGSTVLGVTWTLTRELVFYLLFSCTILHRGAGITLLAAWQAAILACTLAAVPLGPWGAAVFDTHNLGFGIGLLVAVAGPLRRTEWELPIAGAGIVAFIGLMLLEWHVSGPFDPEFRPLGPHLTPILYSLSAGLVLLGLASYDEHHVRPERPIIRALAGCSYVLYLVHGPVGSIAIRAIGRLHLPSALLFLVLAVIGVAAAMLLHLFIEKPILKWLRPGRRPAPSGPQDPPADLRALDA